MNDNSRTANSPFFGSICMLLAVIAFGMACGRIFAAMELFEPGRYRDKDDTTSTKRPWPEHPPASWPLFSSNDRSRWATVRAIVDEGTYHIGKRTPVPGTNGEKYKDEGIIFEDGWNSVDKVMPPPADPDSVSYFYSSKPPLMATVVAGEYWVLKHAFGLNFSEDRWVVIRTGLITFNAIPFFLYLLLLGRLIDLLGGNEWAKVAVFALAAFGTFLTPFMITLNNHTIAACCALYALYPAVRMWHGETPSAWKFAVAGFFASLTACVELPAASFLVFLSLMLLWRWPRQTLLFFVPLALVPIGGLFLTNWIALGRLTPAYGEFGGPWYRYPGSHWDPNGRRSGIDWAADKEGRLTYAFHFLLGHHGVFSLTPAWLLAFLGMGWGLWRMFGRKPREVPGTPSSVPSAASPAFVPLAVLTLALSVVVLGFFLAWVSSRNYGGGTSGPRWLIWLVPFWLLCCLPVVDWLARRRWGRGLTYLLVGISVMSVAYPAWNPWRQPWIYHMLDAFGGIPY